MSELNFQQLAHGITCIDANYVDRGMACFYLLEQGGEYAVIETGTSHSVAALTALMELRGIEADCIRYVIPTHVHLDHAGGAGAMMAQFPQTQLVIHPRGARHMIEPQRLIESTVAVYGEKVFRQLYGDIVPVDAQRVMVAGDGDCVELSGRRLQMRHTRGHANHHFCIWDEASKGWFTGDMFGICYPWFRFAGGDFLLPSTTPTQFDPAAYLESLATLDSYGPSRMFLTHYGELAYSAEKSQLLARQVEAWRDLALQDDSNVSTLQGKLEAHSLQLLRRLDDNNDEAQHRAWLKFDTKLNAQGIQFWLQKN